MQKIAKFEIFLKNQSFGFLIISLVTLNLKECTTPQIKAKKISFGPYVLNKIKRL